MNSKFSSTDGQLHSKNKVTWIILSLALLVMIIIFTNVEMFLVVAKGTYAAWYIFVIYYVLELAFLSICYFWLFPALSRSLLTRPISLLYIPLAIFAGPVVSVVLRIYIYHLHNRTLTFNELRHAFNESFYRHCHIFFLALLIYLGRLAITYFRRNKKYEVIVDEYKAENRNLHAIMLGVQMNPHLMVNVLNAIQGNILEKSPESFHLIHNLTSIHEHILTKSDKEVSSTLADEIELINRIVTLYSSIGKELGVFDISSVQGSEEIAFPANLLSPLIENIFKHADFNDPNALPEVRLSMSGSYLRLAIWNKTLQKPQYQNRRSIGLNNCLERLKYHYPNQFQFSSVTNNGFYLLTLSIKIADYD